MTLAVKVALNLNTTNQPRSTINESLHFRVYFAFSNKRGPTVYVNILCCLAGKQGEIYMKSRDLLHNVNR